MSSELLHKKKLHHNADQFRIRSSSLILPNRRKTVAGAPGHSAHEIQQPPSSPSQRSASAAASGHRKTHSLYNLFGGGGKACHNHRLR